MCGSAKMCSDHGAINAVLDNCTHEYRFELDITYNHPAGQTSHTLVSQSHC